MKINKITNRYYVVKINKGYWYGPIDDYTTLVKGKKFNVEYWSKDYVEKLMSKKLGDFGIAYVVQILEITHEIIEE